MVKKKKTRAKVQKTPNLIIETVKIEPSILSIREDDSLSMKSAEKNIFAENIVYHFRPDGTLVPNAERKETDILMVKLIPISKKVADEIIFRQMKSPATTKTEKRLSLFIKWIYDEKNMTKWKGILKPIIKFLRRTFSGYETFGNDNAYLHRYGRVHLIAKNWLFKPSLKIVKKAIGRYAIQSLDDIPDKPYNVHHRIFYHSWQDGLIDTFVGPLWDKGQKRPESRQFQDKEAYVQWLVESKYWSWDNRSSIINLWMTEIMEDTFDREWLNYFMLRMYHELHSHYGGNVPQPNEYPHYVGIVADNPDYFRMFENHPTWQMDKTNTWAAQVEAWKKIPKVITTTEKKLGVQQ